MKPTKMRTWAEIDLNHLEHNYRALRAMLPQGCRFLGVIKANAYGHGAIQVGRKLEALGAEYLAVACLREAVELRDGGGISAPVLILGHTPVEFADRLVEYGFTQTVFDLETARALSQAAIRGGKPLKIHVKVDTGMSRLGFLCDEAGMDAVVEEIATLCALPGLEAEGIFTHFSDADGSETYTMLQFTRFLDLLEKLEAAGLRFPIRHCANSAAMLNYPCTHMDMVRPGIALYGHYPAPACAGLDGPGLLPVMSLHSRIAAIKEVPAGVPVSYGRIHTLVRNTRLATLPVGYADGLFRLCSDKLSMRVGDGWAPVVGRVCMDMCMLDVTDLPQVKPGDVVTVFGPDVPIETAADLVGTVQYELLCAISPRVPREYIGE